MLVFRLSEGDGKLKGVLGVDEDVIPAFKALRAAFYKGILARSNKRVQVGPQRMPNQ